MAKIQVGKIQAAQHLEERPQVGKTRVTEHQAEKTRITGRQMAVPRLRSPKMAPVTYLYLVRQDQQALLIQ